MRLEKGDRIKIIKGSFKNEVHHVYWADSEKIKTYENPNEFYKYDQIIVIEEQTPPPNRFGYSK